MPIFHEQNRHVWSMCITFIERKSWKGLRIKSAITTTPGFVYFEKLIGNWVRNMRKLVLNKGSLIAASIWTSYFKVSITYNQFLHMHMNESKDFLSIATFGLSSYRRWDSHKEICFQVPVHPSRQNLGQVSKLKFTCL